MNKAFYNIRNQLAELHDGFRQGMDWYKQEMDKIKAENEQLKTIIQNKDKEIEELKSKLNAESK